MILRTRPAVAFVFFLTTGAVGQIGAAQAPPSASPPSPVIVITSLVMQDGTRYQYEITQDRADKLPPWDQRATSEPPLSMSAARKAAEAWLTSRTPEIKTFEVSSLTLFKIIPRTFPGPCSQSGCWYYRITFDPVVGGRRLNGGGDFTAVVLLDGSIVEPRVDTASGQLPAPPSPPAPSSTPVRVGGNVPQPREIKHVNPVYPAVAQTSRVQGLVIIEATIGVDGKVQDAKVLRSIPLLDAAALDAVRQWEYTPTMLNGVPVPVIMTVTVNFSLQ